ncbi:MAG TPA: NADH-quinone oxidoreductase subunit NuoG [Candidatus Sulfotelmatobacter sp.]|nr:NADH-quinone oxidoreductase subunit NuoG [Candidatus Sulfotelmatobacter sp.]
MADVNITVDGKKITQPAGTLLIDACKSAGIEIPSFCYYPGLSLQGACRMCLVEIAKMPKLQTACTTFISEGMAVTAQSETVKQARKAMLEFVLQNHPLDCPVCDAGGQCELQDATLSYGPGESKLIDLKNHKDEQQWSPVVYFDRPRCIMCYRCVRVCGEGMDVWALGIANRNSSQLIVPNKGAYLECEECGMCIDICPVGALTSGPYRYKTRPWEMKHVATICTHCGDGCTTTLGVRPSETGMEIVRGSNRDKNGINGDFLCIKGRYAFDFTAHPERLKQPLIRRNGRLLPASWEDALSIVAGRFREVRETFGGDSIGVIGSTRTTNEESYLLQKVARIVFHTNNIDHHRTADFPTLSRVLAGKPHTTASMKDVSNAPAILLIGSDPTYQHPLLAWQIRNNVRLHHARLYLINRRPIKLTRQATRFVQVDQDSEGAAVAFLAGDDSAREQCTTDQSGRDKLTALREKLQTEKDLVIIFGSELSGKDIAALVRCCAAIPDAKLVCLGDYANSRGAADMGLYPDLMPGYTPLSKGAKFREAWDAGFPAQPGLNLLQMIEAAKEGRLKALYVVGSNPVARYHIDPFVLQAPFLAVQDLFLTETAQLADVVLPAACAYEKSGTFTNTCGDLQRLRKAAEVVGPKSDLEIIARLAHDMGCPIGKLVTRGQGVRADTGQSRGAQSGEVDRQAVWMQRQNLEPRLGPFDPNAVLDEIRRLVPSYCSPHVDCSSQKQAAEFNQSASRDSASEGQLIVPSQDDLFSSGTLGRYCGVLEDVMESRLVLPNEREDCNGELLSEPRQWNDPGSVCPGS